MIAQLLLKPELGSAAPLSEVDSSRGSGPGAQESGADAETGETGEGHKLRLPSAVCSWSYWADSLSAWDQGTQTARLCCHASNSSYYCMLVVRGSEGCSAGLHPSK
jgi:hypothetical protein